MEFHETGLPNEVNVIKAFRSYQQIADSQPAANDPHREYPLRVAQLLAEYAPENTDLVILSLLQYAMPPETDGIVETRYGDKALALLQAARLHGVTGAAWLDRAPEEVKLLQAAQAIVMFGDYAQATADLVDKIDDIKNRRGRFQLTLPVIPQPGAFAAIGRSLDGVTGNLELVNLFSDQFYTFLENYKTFSEKMTELELQLPPPPRAEDERALPYFEEAGLRDSDAVRNAYEHVAIDPRTGVKDAPRALSAAKILSDCPSVSDTTVALSLLDIGIRALTPQDTPFIEEIAGWDVAELLNKQSVHNFSSPAATLKAPVEFRQVMLAHLTGTIELARGTLSAAIAAIEEKEKEEGAGSTAPERAQVHQESFMLDREIWAATQPLLMQTEAPDLEKKFMETTRSFREMYTKLTPPSRSRDKGISFD